MSKNNNVNPGQYKVAGRERQGEDIVPEEEKAELTRNQHETHSTPDPKSIKSAKGTPKE